MSADPRIPDALDEFLTRLRADLDAHGAALTATVLEHSQQGEEAWRARIDEAEARFADERLVLERQLADERIGNQAAMSALKAAARDARVETFTRLLRAVRRLDEATSLSAILEALAKGTVAEVARVAVLVVEPEGFRVWGHFGFAEGQGPSEGAVGRVAALATAVTTQQTSILSADDGEAADDLPAFMRPPAGQAGLIAPLAVGGEVVAVLYAEGAERRSEQEEAAVWAEEVELLVRHAAARLENVTSERTVAVLTRTV
jgi:hypothetical protein